jgi:hypothetical protein
VETLRQAQPDLQVTHCEKPIVRHSLTYKAEVAATFLRGAAVVFADPTRSSDRCHRYNRPTPGGRFVDILACAD